VEDRVLEIEGLNSESGLIMGDFVIQEGFAPTTHVARGSVAKTPYFLEIISCLVLIMGETADLGHNLCLNCDGKNRSFP
jgi:hypothetical protein